MSIYPRCHGTPFVCKNTLIMFDFFKKKTKEPAELCFATDIHCHVVPGIDDGSPDARTSADLIERMQSWGIRRIIASPHVTQHTFENDLSTITPAMQELQAELANRGNDIPVSHSAEYRIDDLFARRLEANELMLLPNDYIIIENAFLQEPWNLDQLVFDLQVRGLRPILAHPERYTYYYGRPERYQALHQSGLLFQINLLSLAGAYGKNEKKIAEHLIDKGLVDFIGTDLHYDGHADTIDSYLLGNDAHKHMQALAGKVKNDTAFN